MICQNCNQKEVTVHYTEIIDGQIVEYHLCEECARQKGVSLTPADAVGELISSLAAAPHPAGDEDLACSGCGLTLKELRSGGRLGCAECYRTFAAQLEPLLKALHKGIRHLGKIPAAGKRTPLSPGEGPAPLRPEIAGGEETEVKRLRREVAAAAAAEDYEQAARLRDRIAELTRTRSPRSRKKTE